MPSPRSLPSPSVTSAAVFEAPPSTPRKYVMRGVYRRLPAGGCSGYEPAPEADHPLHYFRVKRPRPRPFQKGDVQMKSNRILTVSALALLAIALWVTAACKSSGMAVTSRGQLLKINITHPTDLPEGGEDNLDVALSNRGVNNIQNVLVDVELPSQLIVLDETHDRGVTMSHDPGMNVYHYTIGNLQPGENSRVRFKVRTAFGTMSETGSVKV